jgi:26S proteasome regulatory subunit N8
MQVDKSKTTEVVVHPLVLLSAADHYNRVAKDTKKRVVGVLLGSRHRNEVDITNSFAVPFEEDPRNPSVWFLDHNFLETMFWMFKKVNGENMYVNLEICLIPGIQHVKILSDFIARDPKLRRMI